MFDPIWGLGRPIFSLAILLMVTFPLHAQKKVLIIAINDYPAAGGWPATHASNDLALISKTFQKQGFSIQTLTDQQATASGIRRALESLFENAKAGEIVTLHYSGHGQQVVDTSGDEADGKDEAIVPYDAPKEGTQSSYSGEKHILDDELGIWVGKMRQKLGKNGQLFVLLDCCYSGTGTRAGSLSVSRSASPLVPENFIHSPGIKSSFLASDSQSAIRSVTTDQLARFILFTGSSAPQQNYEVKGANGLFYGALSYALAESMENLSAGETYRTLFRKTSEHINRRILTQTPTCEGDVDAALFGGNITTSTSGIAVLTEGIAKLHKTVRIAAGYLNGIAPHTLIGFWNTGSPRGDGKVAVHNGKVTHVDLTYSEVELDPPLTTEQLAGLEADGDLRLWQGTSTTIFIENSEKESTAKLKNTLSKHQLKITDRRDQADLIVKVVDHTTYLLSADSYRLLDSASTNSAPDLVRNYAYANFLRGLEVQSNLKAVISLVNEKGEDAGSYPRIEVRAHSKVQLQIQNTGIAPFYAHLLDIQPNAVVTSLLPSVSKGYPEVKVKPGETYEIPIVITPPFGLETFKVILTTQPVALSAAPVRSTSVFAHPLAPLLSSETYRNSSSSLPETSISSLFFSIVDSYTPILKK